MRLIPKLAAEPIQNGFFINSSPRPLKAYHLRIPSPISWTLARDIQNALVKAYQSHHFNVVPRKVLPPTFITLRFRPVFTYGRNELPPSELDRKLLGGFPPGPSEFVADTRMAWGRDQGWQFHGPGQIHCWIVADLEHWNVSTQSIN